MYLRLAVTYDRTSLAGKRSEVFRSNRRLPPISGEYVGVVAGISLTFSLDRSGVVEEASSGLSVHGRIYTLQSRAFSSGEYVDLNG